MNPDCITVTELREQPQLTNALWCQLEQVVSQLKCVISDSMSPEFQTKGAILDNFMKVHVNQKGVHPRSLLSQKKQKTTRSDVRCCTIAGNNDTQQVSVMITDSKTPADRTLSRVVSPDERCSNPAFSPSGSEPQPTAALPHIKCTASRKRGDSTARRKSNTTGGGANPPATVSNVERLQREREAMLAGMRTGIVDATPHRKRNCGRRTSQLSTVPSDVATYRGLAKTVANSDVLTPSDKNDENQTTSKNEQESRSELQNGKDGRKIVYSFLVLYFCVNVEHVLICI